MKSVRLLALLLLTCSFFAACNGGGNQSSNSRDDGWRETGVTENDADAVHNSIRDCRIIVYQPKTRSSMIMVNRRHSLRKTSEGRLRLALGQRSGGYNTLSDRAIDQIIEDFKNLKGHVIRQSFTRDDERLLNAGPNDIPGYKGVIIVENGGQRWKYVGMSPKGNELLAQKYQIFVNMKVYAARRHGDTGPMESPSSTGMGQGDTNQFTDPEWSDRVRRR